MLRVLHLLLAGTILKTHLDFFPCNASVQPFLVLSLRRNVVDGLLFTHLALKCSYRSLTSQ